MVFRLVQAIKGKDIRTDVPRRAQYSPHKATGRRAFRIVATLAAVATFSSGLSWSGAVASDNDDALAQELAAAAESSEAEPQSIGALEPAGEGITKELPVDSGEIAGEPALQEVTDEEQLAEAETSLPADAVPEEEAGSNTGDETEDSRLDEPEAETKNAGAQEPAPGETAATGPESRETHQAAEQDFQVPVAQLEGENSSADQVEESTLDLQSDEPGMMALDMGINQASGCSYADAGTGSHARTICWLDFGTFNTNGQNVVNQPVTITLSGGYEFSARLSSTGADGGSSASPDNRFRSRYVRAASFPTWGGAFLGNRHDGQDFYTGVAGNPALYQYRENGSGGQTDADTTLTLSDIQLRHNGEPVSGYSMVVADAETTDEDEWIEWTTTGGDFSILPNGPGNDAGNACQQEFTVSGKDARCAANASSVKNGTPMLVTAATSVSPWSVTQRMLGDGLQGVAFGLMFAKASAEVEMTGRIADDQFTVSMEAPQMGTTAVTATTQGADQAGLSASTGERELVVPVGASASVHYGLSGTAASWQADYSQYWVCTVGGNTVYEGSNSPQQALSVGVGEHLHCKVTLTPPTLTLQKSVVNRFAGTAEPAGWQLEATRDGATTPTLADASGNPGVTNVPVRAGGYVIREHSGPDGYEARGWVCDNEPSGDGESGEVQITAGMDSTCIVTNWDLPGLLTWVKTDATSGEELAGSVWELTGPGATGPTRTITDCVSDEISECAGEDKDPAAGQFQVEGLHWGDYTLVEMQAPAGYLISDGEEITFAVNGDALTVQLGEVQNVRVLGSAEWVKTDAETNEAIAGSVWELYGPEAGQAVRVEDCVAADSAGCDEEIDRNPEPGIFRITDLAWGTYTLVEIEAPEGYELGEGEQTFTVGPETVGAVINLGNVTNERALGSVSWSKVGPDGNRLDRSVWRLTGPEIDGAQLDYEVEDCVADNAEDCTGADRDPDAGGFLIEDLEWGYYELVETSAPAGYVLDDTVHDFTISPEAGLDFVFEQPFENVPRQMPVLPLTGGLGRDFFIIAGLSVLTLGLGALMAVQYRRRREGVA